MLRSVSQQGRWATEFRVLGSFEVYDGRRQLPLGPAKQRALLAILLLNRGRAVSVDRLADELWGERPPEKAAKSIQVYVSHLRKVLGDEVVRTQGRAYVLDPEGHRVDLDRFDELLAQGRDQVAAGEARQAAGTLRDALSLWRGSPLEDFAYEPFAQAEITRLEELRLAALEERIDADLALGRDDRLVPELEMLIRVHPLRERLRGQLMLALYRSGRQADALAAYRDGRQKLLDELGLEPGPELKELERAILAQDPSLQGPARRAARASEGRRRGLTIAAGAALLLGAAIAAVIVVQTRGGGASLADVPPDSVARIDSRTNRVVAQTSLAGSPGRVAVGGSSVWVASDDSGTLSALDLRTQRPMRLVTSGGFPSDVAFGESGLWVVDGRSGLLRKIDLSYGRVAGTVRVAPANAVYDISRESFDSTSVAAGAGSIWVTNGSSQLVRVDPTGGHVAHRIDLGAPLDGVAVAGDAVWAISGKAAAAVRLDRDGRVVVRIPIVSRPGFESPYPLDVGVGEGFVWVLNANTATVTKIDPEQRTVSATIAIGIDRSPAKLAVGSGAAWVANGDGTLSRIDPSSNAVETIPVGHRLKDVTVGGGAVWVITGSGSSGIATGTVSGGPVHALPTSSCSPIYFEGTGHPRYLIASDLPLQGQGTFVPQLSQAIQFVLRQRHFRAGRYAVGYQSCDDSTAPEGLFSEARCTANGSAYAADNSVIGVIGPFNSGCAQVELPVLNRRSGGSLATIGFSNTYVGLTRSGPGTAAGEPGIYFPTGRRNYVRIIAADHIQGAAAAVMARRLGAHRVYVLSEPFAYGRGTNASFAVAAKKLGLVVAGNYPFAYGLESYAPLAAQVAKARPDLVYFSASLSAEGNLGRLLADLRAAAPRVTILAPDGFSDFGLLRTVAGPAAEGMLISVPGAPNGQLSATGKDFLATFGKAVGEHPQAYVAGAAQATEVLLDAIGRSDGTRASVTKELFSTKVKNGILGTFAIDRNGDTTGGAVTFYRIVHGSPTVATVITPRPALVP